MADIKKLRYENKDFYPLTHVNAIVDDNGEFIKDKYVTMANFLGTNDFTVGPLMPEEIEELNARLNIVADNIQNNTLGTLVDKIGNLNNLQTSNKSNAVVAINDVISNSESIQNTLNSKLNKNTYDNKIATLTQNLNSVTAATNNIKNRLVDVLIDNNINASNSESISSLIEKVEDVEGEQIELSFPEFVDLDNIFFNFIDNDSFPILNSHIAVDCDGLIHIFGGVEGSSPEGGEEYNFNHYCFDTDLGTTTTVSTNERCYLEGSAVVYNNLIYVYGLYATRETITEVAAGGISSYSPTTGTWTDRLQSSNIEPIPRYHHTMVLGSNNDIYFIGGIAMDGSGPVANTIYSYSLTYNNITTRPHLSTQLYAHSSAAVGNYIYVFGGADTLRGHTLDSVYRYDVSSNSWSNRTDMPSPLAGFCTIVQDQDVYMFGGYYYDIDYNVITASASYCYNTSSDSYLINARYNGKFDNCYSKAVMRDGIVYAIGGKTPDYIPHYTPLVFCTLNKNTFEYIDDWAPPSTPSVPSVEPLTIMSDCVYTGTTQFKTYSTRVTYNSSNGLSLKSSNSTYHVWAVLNTAIDTTNYYELLFSFKAGLAGTYKFMIAASTSSGTSGTGASTPTFNSGTSGVIPTYAYNTNTSNTISVDISSLTGYQYIYIVACYDSDTVYYNNYGLYITEFLLR